MPVVDRPVLVEPRARLLSFALGASAAAVALFFFGPVFVNVFHPSETYRDFTQEWLSTRNFWSGEPVYLPQRHAMLRHTGRDLPSLTIELPWNAHPPIAVLAALPFGLIQDYATAHQTWNLVTFLLFV